MYAVISESPGRLDFLSSVRSICGTPDVGFERLVTKSASRKC